MLLRREENQALMILSKMKNSERVEEAVGISFIILIRREFDSSFDVDDDPEEGEEEIEPHGELRR
jgi:hypothetical protein